MGTTATTDHIAFVTGDTEKTVDFYTRVMRWPLVGAHRGTEPDGREFFMTAFAADGYSIEFEEIDGRPPSPTYAIGFPHFGIDVGTLSEYNEWKTHLEACRVEYLEVARGEFFITDPNGVSFQFIVKEPNEAAGASERTARAEQMVKRWIEERRQATAQPDRDNGPDAVHTRLSGAVIGCGDAWALAEFYASLLGWNVVDRSEDVPGGWALVRSPIGERKLEFQREEPFVPPVWPTVAGEQQMGMHLDIAVEGLASMNAMDQRREQFGQVVEYAVSLGARVAEHQPQPARVVVMLDPAGHPFCLFPGNV